MSRYIDADSLKKQVERLQDCYNGFSDTYDKACIIGLIDEEPTADVVPVVRCKDCKHKYAYNNVWLCRFGGKILGCDGYCSYGEQVTE